MVSLERKRLQESINRKWMVEMEALRRENRELKLENEEF